MLLYDSKFLKHPSKLQMNWLGPYLVQSITSGGAIQLQQLDGAMFLKLIKEIHLKPYRIKVDDVHHLRFKKNDDENSILVAHDEP